MCILSGKEALNSFRLRVKKPKGKIVAKVNSKKFSIILKYWGHLTDKLLEEWETEVIESRFVLVLHLIGWERWGSF